MQYQSDYVLRLVGIVGGLTVPALVSLNVRQGHVAETIAWITFVVSLVVAIAIAIEGFFRYGERWRHYRRTVEQMKGQGWQFYELAGSYAGYRSHRAAFHPFATAVEGLLAEEVDVYVRQIARDQRLPDDKTDDQQGGAEGEPVDEQGAAESEPAEQGGFPEAEPEEPQGGFPKAEPEEPQGGFPKAEPEGEPKD